MAIPDELAEQILLRLPPDEPACLLRASLVCKRWRRLISHPNFLRSLHKLHPKPPLLGFFHSFYHGFTTRFTPTTTSAFSVPVPDRGNWYALDCRHGRVLFCSKRTKEDQYRIRFAWDPITDRQKLKRTHEEQDLLVWEPITGHKQLVPVATAFKSHQQKFVNATVLCAAEGCDHHGCHGGPFRVVLSVIAPMTKVLNVRMYSSETRLWGDVTSTIFHFEPLLLRPNALVRKSLLYFMSSYACLLEYDLAGRSLVVINLPNAITTSLGSIIVMPTKDGGLGVAKVKETCLHLWSREANGSGDAGWVQSAVIELDKMLPITALLASPIANVIGFAEEANAIFVRTITGIFGIDLGSEPARKVYAIVTRDSDTTFLPFSSFYIPGMQVGTDRELLEEEADVLQRAVMGAQSVAATPPPSSDDAATGGR